MTPAQTASTETLCAPALRSPHNTPPPPRGRRARRLALTAFTDYARAGSKWAASGRARFAHYRSAAITFAHKGATYARTGNTLLVSAGKLLR